MGRHDHHYLVPGHFHHPTPPKNPGAVNSRPPVPAPLAPGRRLSASRLHHVPVLNTSHQWACTPCDSMAFFAPSRVVRVRPRRSSCRRFVPFQGWVIFLCGDGRRSVCPSSVDGRLDHLHLSVITAGAAVNVRASSGRTFSFFWGQITGSDRNSAEHFENGASLHRLCAISIPTSKASGSQSLHLLADTCYFLFLFLSLLNSGPPKWACRGEPWFSKPMFPLSP